MLTSIVLVALLGVSVNSQNPSGPVIGVFTQSLGEDYVVKGSDGEPKSVNGTHKSYIAASYIKFVESSGGRVVPIKYSTPLDDLTTLFGQINGILFPGGAADITDFDTVYDKALIHMWNLAMDANAKGDYFPIWGTCLGFETVSVLAAMNGSVLGSGFDSEDIALPLDFTPMANSSRFLTGAPANVYTAMAFTNSTMNNHHSGVTPETFMSNPKLASFFNVISTSTDRQGRVFGSTIEGKTIPVYGVQWHPEKTNFEWTNREAIPHTADAIMISQYAANFFISEARKSKHTFDYDSLNKVIIWNYQPEFCFLEGSNFEQRYTFIETA